MRYNGTNFEKPEEELGSTSTPFEIPLFLGWLVTVASVLMIFSCVFLFKKFLDAPTVYASPVDLGLTSIFMFSVSAIMIVWMPWKKLGIRITKIGGIEFKDVIAEQASEHAEEISYLQDRIETLEANYRRSNEMANLTEGFQEPELRKLLMGFLIKYKDWAFSPSRIRAWGSQQQGFSALSNYDHHFIRSTLQKMVSEGHLETRISKKGNTLYRVPLP